LKSSQLNLEAFHSFYVEIVTPCGNPPQLAPTASLPPQISAKHR